MDLEHLRSRFALPGVVDIAAGEGGLTKLVLTAAAGAAEVYLHGAHVTQFAPQGEPGMLFVSRKSHYVTGKAIRGGVPVIFPWFGPHPSDSTLAPHGFVRNRVWNLEAAEKRNDGTVAVELTLTGDGSPTSISPLAWPYAFALRYTIVVGGTLAMNLQVTNTSQKSFRFEEALHTYLSVSDVRRSKIDGLSGRTYFDKTDRNEKKVQPHGTFNITGETDRVYVDTPDTVVVTDPAGSAAGVPRVLAVTKENSASTIVWNPWIAKAAALTDFDDDEWTGMLCIETANVGNNAITLAPGESHVMTATVGIP